MFGYDIAMDDDLPGIRRSWAQRLWSTGKIAGSAARLATRRLVNLEGDQDARLGEALARELDQMKGMAMKVGQILSYFDGILPPQTHKALQKLQQGDRGVCFETMAEVIAEQLGPVHTVFSDFNPTPIASASIGQVYRARVGNREVAVKVQYPGIAETIAGDFSRLQTLSKLASLATAVDGPALVRELQERFCEECNYIQEAASLRLFGQAFADDPDITIPGVLRSHSSERVLTMDWCPGAGFYTFTAAAEAPARQRAGEVLVRFAYRSLFQFGMLNADPHPGNYLFPESGRVVCLDFGCIRKFNPDYLEAWRNLLKVVLDNRRNAFEQALARTGEVARPRGFDYDHHWAMYCHALAPYSEPAFDITTEYLRRGMDFGHPSNPNLRKIAIDPQWIWIQRLQWGLHAVLHKLGVRGNWGEILRTYLETPLTEFAPET